MNKFHLVIIVASCVQVARSSRPLVIEYNGAALLH